MEIGFDNEKYLQMQSQRIKERIAAFGGKLYLEFGGKVFPFSAIDSRYNAQIIDFLSAYEDEISI